MNSFNSLYSRLQIFNEAKPNRMGQVVPVFADINKRMTRAGMPASSRDAQLFVLQVLSRVEVISTEEHDLLKTGQNKERLEKIVAILRDKEEIINAKEAEIVEFMNNNLDNYTSAAGTDRGRTDKYKETAKMISQEIQNIAAGKQADDALRDIILRTAEGLKKVEMGGPAELDFDDVDVFIDIPGDTSGEIRNQIAQKVVDQLNTNGYTAEVTNAGLNVEGPVGQFGDAEKAQDLFTGLVRSLFPSIPEKAVTAVLNTNTEDQEDPDYEYVSDEEFDMDASDLDDDGEISEYERRRGEAIASATVNENGQTSPTQQYLAEQAEHAIEEVYTAQYLTEQKVHDSLYKPNKEKHVSFKERYKPKTYWQLEEARRYGL